jgi:hypothetical protein
MSSGVHRGGGTIIRRTGVLGAPGTGITITVIITTGIIITMGISDAGRVIATRFGTPIITAATSAHAR